MKPDWDLQRAEQHITNIINNHIPPNEEAISILTGDTNGRHQTLGDKLTDNRGKLLIQKLTKANLQVLNETLAQGKPTNNTQTYQKGQLIQGSSIVDWIITPNNQADYWENIHISHKERETAQAHHILTATSKIIVTTTTKPTNYKYTINYNQANAYCLKKYTKLRLEPLHKQLMKITRDTLARTQIQEDKKTIMTTMQFMVSLLHHITGLLVFGLRTSRHGHKNQWALRNNEIEQICNNIDYSHTEKQQYLNPIVKKIIEDRKQKKCYEQISEATTDMFRRYSKNKNSYKTPYPDKMNNHEHKLRPATLGYAVSPHNTHEAITDEERFNPQNIRPKEEKTSPNTDCHKKTLKTQSQ